MCGIAGYLVLGGVPPEADTLDRMAARLAHRGPDGRGFWRTDGAGLAHTRLAIIDLESGRQPLCDVGGTVLVANGEVYNHVELRTELQREGFRFRTRSDCEPILHGWRRWGMDLLARLRGMYAFALYDPAERQLLLVRDRLGIKPLYYLIEGGVLYFASELKALMPALRHGPRIELAAVGRYLQSNFSSGRQTAIQGIERVLPGEAMLVRPDGTIRRCRYWRPPPCTNVRTLALDEALDRFEHLMREAMALHLRADVPVGIFLSGGLDSSTLLTLGAGLPDGPTRAWTVSFQDASVHDESAVAARLAHRARVCHETVGLDERRLLGRLPHAVWATDELMGDYAMLPVSFLAEAAARTHKVVLSGEGGDEVFAGYGRYRLPWPRRLLRAFRHPGTGGFRTRPALSPGLARRLLVPELAGAARQWREPFRDAWQDAGETCGTLGRMQRVDLDTWLPDDLLVKVDRQLMAWGVEGRVPYLDHRVVEFGLLLPDRLKVAGRRGKILLRRWAERRLPAEVWQGRKRGFTVPVRAWLRGRLLARLAEILPRTEMARMLLRPGAVEHLARAHRRNGRHTQILWSLLVLAVWHRALIERSGEPPPPDLRPEDYLAS